jgi:signal transduction histidine kinase
MALRSRFLLIELAIIFIWILGFCHIWQKPTLPFEVFGRMNITSPDTSVSTVFRIGDTLKVIDSIRITSRDEMEFVLDRHAVGDTVILKVMGTISPEPYNAEVQLKRFYSPIYFIVILLSAGIFLGIAVVVRRRRPVGTDIQIFHTLCIAMGSLVISTTGRYAMPLGIGYVVSAVFYAAYSFSPVLLLMFSRIFPTDRRAETLQLQRVIIRIASILAALLIISFIIAAAGNSITVYRVHFVLFRLCQIWFAAIVVLTMVSFYSAYTTAIIESERRKILWITVGISISTLPFVGLWQIPQFILGHPILPETIIILLATIAPISFAIALIRYRIMDITLLINRSAVYVIVSGAAVLVYAIIFGIVLKISHVLNAETTFIVSAISVIINVALFAPTKGIIQRFVDRTFFRVNYEYRNVQRVISERIASAKTISDVGNILAQSIASILSVDKIALFVRENDDLRLIVQKGLHNISPLGEERNTVNQLLAEKKIIGLTHFIEPEVEIETGYDELLNSVQLVTVFPILDGGGELLGGIIIGEKKSGTRFTAEDFDVLAAAARESCTTIERVNLLQQMVVQQAESRRLEELNRMKSFFVSGVSHELKTPLTAIRMFAEMLRNRTEGTKAQEYLDIIEGESARLSRLIDTILDFAQVERGIKEYRRHPAELNSIIRNVVSVMRYEFEKEGFIVESRIASKELLFSADTDAIAEAVMNLLVNAIKYSQKEHSIILTTFQKDGFVCVSIEDKGIGIPTESFEAIFKPFVRLKDEATQRVGGAGLGLALVKHITEGHAGRVELESTLNIGSKFTLCFAES